MELDTMRGADVMKQALLIKAHDSVRVWWCCRCLASLSCKTAVVLLTLRQAIQVQAMCVCATDEVSVDTLDHGCLHCCQEQMGLAG